MLHPPSGRTPACTASYPAVQPAERIESTKALALPAGMVQGFITLPPLSRRGRVIPQARSGPGPRERRPRLRPAPSVSVGPKTLSSLLFEFQPGNGGGQSGGAETVIN